MSWSTGWISQGVAALPRSSTKAPRFPTVSSRTLRSPQMTSGLFNTGGAGDSSAAAVTSFNNPPVTTVTAQPSPSPSPSSFSMSDKMAATSGSASSAAGEALMLACGGHDDDDSLADAFDADFDMEMFGDLAGGGGGDLTFDPLGDESLDSFTDLTAFLSEGNMMFLDPMKTDDSELAAFPDIGNNDDDSVKTTTTTTSLKRSFDQMAAVEQQEEEAETPANAGVATTTTIIATSSNHDHDYSSKRPRLANPPTIVIAEQPAAVDEDEVFIAPPAPLSAHPTPSTSSSFVAPLLTHPTPTISYIINPPEKSRSRREKNNVASKRSRETRKLKFKDMEEEAEHLIAENARMEKRVVELERLAKQMKEILVAKMAGK